MAHAQAIDDGGTPTIDLSIAYATIALANRLSQCEPADHLFIFCEKAHFEESPADRECSSLAVWSRIVGACHAVHNFYKAVRIES
jgi:hypothetical protein